MSNVNTYIPEVGNFVKSALANQKIDDMAGVHIENLTINQNTPGTSTSIGGRVKKQHIPSGIVYAIIAATVAIILIVAAYLIYANRSISNELSEIIAEDVRIVAKCEGKSSQKVHSELRKKYGYGTYKAMSVSTYYDVKTELDSRKCDIDMP